MFSPWGSLVMDVVINVETKSVPEGSQPIPNQGHFYHHILSCLGYPLDAPPVADLLRCYHGLQGDWLIASPIHWVATHNDAMIEASGEALQLSDTESRAWFEVMTEFLAHEHITTFYHDAYTWLIQPREHPNMIAKPVNSLRHQSMMPQLQLLDSSFFWQRLITEHQMLFSAHPLNKARLDRHSINGIWIWGGGQLQPRGNRPIVCGDAEWVRLASHLSTRVEYCDFSHSDDHNRLRLTRNTLLLLNSVDQTVLQKLQHRWATTCWYWNNIAYKTNGMRRLWRRFFYAN